MEYNYDNSISDRYSSLRHIFEYLIENQLISNNTTVDFSEVMRDLYHLNLLIHQSYIIFKKHISKEQKVSDLMNLRDIDGKRFMDRTFSKKIVEHYSDNIVNFYDALMLLQKRKKQFIGGKAKNNTHVKFKQCAGANEINYKDNLIDNLISDKEFMRRNKEILMNSPIAQLLSTDPRKYITNIIDFGKIYGFSTGEYIFNWIFFPLAQLEQIPVIGDAIAIPLDIIGIILDNLDLLMDFIGPVVPIALGVATDLGAAIPVPGVNTAFAGLSLATTLGSKPTELLLTNFLDIIGLVLNIQRKQWGLAYLSAMDAIPNFSSVMDVVVTELYMANKYIAKAKDFMAFVDDTTRVMVPLSQTILQNPAVLFRPREIVEKIIIPNKHRIPIIKNLPIEKWFEGVNKLTKLKTQFENIQNVSADIISGKNLNKIADNYIKDKIGNYSSELNESLIRKQDKRTI
jgi:hypothetical protein